MLDCKIETRVIKTVEKKLISEIEADVINKAISYVVEGDRVFITHGANQSIKTFKVAKERAEEKVQTVNNIYRPWAKGNVVSLDTSRQNAIAIKIHPTQELIDVYEIEQDRKEYEAQQKAVQGTLFQEQSSEDITPLTNYQTLLSLKPNTNITENEWSELELQEQEVIIYQAKNC